MSSYYESVEIVGWNRKRLHFNNINIEKICNKIPFEIPIAVLNVSGEFRTGKSTFLNLIISILKKYEITGNINTICKKDLKLEYGCLNEGKNNKNGFGWKAGNEPCTKGIKMLNYPFIIPNPCNKSQKMAVLLVDTEGLEANDSINGSNQILFGISNLISSVLILNQKGQIGQSDMTNLRLLAEFCPAEKENKNGSFCGIELLMRDFKYEEEELKEQLKEIEKFKHDLFYSEEESIIEVISSSFRYVDCFALPHPGDEVESEDFKGNMEDFDDEFKESVLYYIKELLRKKLYPTYESKEQLCCLCKTINTFMSKGITQLSQMHKILIENKNLNRINEIVNELINPLKEKFKRNNLSVEELQNECEVVYNKLEEYRKQFDGIEGMVHEKMEYIYEELEDLQKECEERIYHHQKLELLEEENKRIREDIQKMRLEIANLKPAPINIYINH